MLKEKAVDFRVSLNSPYVVITQEKTPRKTKEIKDEEWGEELSLLDKLDRQTIHI